MIDPAGNTQTDAKLAREREREQAQVEAWERDEAAQEFAENARAGWEDWDDQDV